jgi:hypothetical protein
VLQSFERAVRDHDEEALTPTLFELDPTEAGAFAALCGAERVRVVDGLDRQLLEWARTELPGEPPGGEACRALIDREIATRGGTPLCYGTWCYYPWRRAVVHLLPRERFVSVRTNRNRDKITREEQARLIEKRVGVVGLSVGHAAALVLAQERLCGELRIADFDQLDLSNLNRLRTSLLNIGRAKTQIAAREIAELDPYVTVRVFPEGVTDGNVQRFFFEGGPLDLVVEECDTLAVKIRVREIAREHGIPVVMDTNDRGLMDVERFDRDRDRPLLHGLLGAVTAADVARLDPAQRLAQFYAFFGGEDRVSPAFRASVRQIGRELVSYPQLASDVHLGGALVGHVAREILLDRLRRSGRYAIDLHRLIADGRGELSEPAAPSGGREGP